MRIITIENIEQAYKEFINLNCDKIGIEIMSSKAVFKTIKIENISAKIANLLKQTFLAKGAEVAVAKGTVDLSIESTDAIIFATIKQYKYAIEKLKMQPWGLPNLAQQLENIIFPKNINRLYNANGRFLKIEHGKTLIMVF